MATTGFLIAPGTSAEDMAEKRRLARAMVQGGADYSPVGHWTQGLARVAQALVGGRELYEIDQQEKAQKDEAGRLIGEALGVGSSPPRESSSVSPTPAPSTPRPVSAAEGSAAAAGRPYPIQPVASPGDATLPAGMRNNNPGNIKFVPSLNYPGLQGPSVNRDQGDPQMVFDNPQNGMNAAASLAYRKYQGGKRSANDLIAGNMGWTPGNTQAAANIARTMGVDPNEDLRLDDPARMQGFLKALTMQEHGQASRQYGDDLYGNAASTAIGGRPAQAGATAAPQAAPAAANTSPLGINPQTASIIQKLSMNPQTAPIAMKLLEAALSPKTQVGRYRPSKQGIVDTVTGQVLAGTEKTGQDAAEYGTDTKGYIDANGNLVYTQMSKAGGRRDVELPEGAKWATGVDKVDTGTGTQLIDKKTGAERGTIQKDVSGKERQEELGKASGQAQIALPAAKTAVENAFQTLQSLRNHPGLNVGTGASTLFDPRSWIPGTEAYNFQALNKQATGQSFMVARDALKGAGQVTDFEGAKGEQAIANLDTAQSKEQYLAALDNLERMMKASYADLQKKSGLGAAPSSNPDAPRPVKTMRFNPQTGEIE